MNLDVHTLFLVTIYVEAILGLLLLFVWAQNTAIHAVACWGFAHLLRAASVTLFGLYGSVSDLISIDLANAVLFTAFGLTWVGARIFDHRRQRIILLFGGALIWLVAPLSSLTATHISPCGIAETSPFVSSRSVPVSGRYKGTLLAQAVSPERCFRDQGPPTSAQAQDDDQRDARRLAAQEQAIPGACPAEARPVCQGDAGRTTARLRRRRPWP